MANNFRGKYFIKGSLEALVLMNNRRRLGLVEQILLTLVVV